MGESLPFIRSALQITRKVLGACIGREGQGQGQGQGQDDLTGKPGSSQRCPSSGSGLSWESPLPSSGQLSRGRGRQVCLSLKSSPHFPPSGSGLSLESPLPSSGQLCRSRGRFYREGWESSFCSSGWCRSLPHYYLQESRGRTVSEVIELA